MNNFTNLRAVFMGAALMISCLFSNSAGSEASWPDISASPATAGGGEKDAAVVVGIDRYGYVAPVPGAARNAEDWYSYFTKGLKVPIERITLLRDNQGTLEKMRRFGEKAAKSVESGGTLWFVFVGHGAPDKDGKDGLLVGADAQQEAESLYTRSLARRELLDILAKGRQEKTVVVIDACFSGRAPGGAPLVAGLQPLVAVGSLAVPNGPKTVIMTAARSDQFAGSLPGEGRPAFSYLTLGALRGWGDDKNNGGDGDGTTTAGEAVAYARKALAALAASLSATAQEPELSSGNPQEALGSGRENGPDLAAMVLSAVPAAPQSEVSFGAGDISAAAPKITVAASGAGLDKINLAAEKLLEAAQDSQENVKALPRDKAEAWCKLSNMEGDNPYGEQARKACQEWKAYAGAFTAQVKSFNADYEKLSGYMRLKRKTKEQKLSALQAFVAAYAPAAKDWPAVFGWAVDSAGRLRKNISLGASYSLENPLLQEGGEAYKAAVKSVAPEDWTPGKSASIARREPGAVDMPSGLIYKELIFGRGSTPVAANKVRVHYKGWLENGTVFDSSYDRGAPAEFPLNGVIACWTEGVQKMNVGGKARLTCPPTLAYGERGVGGIPGNSTLIFEVELLDIVREQDNSGKYKKK